MSVIDFRLRPAWQAGADGLACPEPPAGVDPAEWAAAHGRGRTAAGFHPDYPSVEPGQQGPDGRFRVVMTARFHDRLIAAEDSRPGDYAEVRDLLKRDYPDHAGADQARRAAAVLAGVPAPA